jgi:NAD/NADP transhydrogenase alpha subunit
VTLQYWSKFDKEKLVTEPASDPTSAFSVTRSSNTTINGSVGVTAAQVPSANVSLGITRSRDLSVEYKMKTWSVSAHQVAQPTNG